MSDVTAADLVADPRLGIDPITASVARASKGYTDDELAHFRISHDDIKSLFVKIYNYKGPSNYKNTSRRRTANLRQHITDATFEDSIDKTPTFTMVVHDPTWELLNSGALQLTIDLNPGRIKNRWYRLSAIDVNDDEITLTFATRNAVIMTYYKKPKKTRRKRMTRAQFIKSLTRSVKQTRIKFICPQLGKRQKVGKTQFPTETARKKHRGKGFTESDRITVGGQPATRPQRICIEKVIQGGIDKKAPDLVIIAALMTICLESNCSETAHAPGNPTHWGAFQQDPRYWCASMARGHADAYKDAVGGYGKQGFYTAAIPYWKSHGPMDLGVFAQHVQGAFGPSNPGYSGKVDSHRDEMQHAFHAFTGVEVAIPGGTDASTSYYKKKFEYMVGPPDGPRQENYLAATYRLAEEVNWSAFWVADALHYQSEEDLFKAKAHHALRRDDDGIEHVQFEWSHGKKINQMTLQVRMERWVCPVGTVVRFDEGGPAEGRWLVTNIRRSMFDELGEITLNKPMREKLEPANEPGSRQQQPSAGVPPSFSDPTGGHLLTIETINPAWSAGTLIDKVVPGYAKYYKMATSLSPAMITEQNHRHSTNVSGTSTTSWHKGPFSLQWAADISNGTHPTNEMDDLASALIQAFNLPSLELPNSTVGYIPGNLVNAYHRGYQFQLIYRTNLPQGGNHYNHVHFGCKGGVGGPGSPPILPPARQ